MQERAEFEMPDIPEFLDRRDGKNAERQAAAEEALRKLNVAPSPKPATVRLSDEDQMKVSKLKYQLRETHMSPLPLASRRREAKKLRKEIDAMKKPKKGKVEKKANAPKPSKPKASAKPKAERKAKPTGEKPKGDIVFEMIARSGGATVAELCDATGWEPHSLRAFISVQKVKRKVEVVSTRKDGTTTYTIKG